MCWCVVCVCVVCVCWCVLCVISISPLRLLASSSSFCFVCKFKGFNKQTKKRKERTFLLFLVGFQRNHSKADSSKPSNSELRASACVAEASDG